MVRRSSRLGGRASGRGMRLQFEPLEARQMMHGATTNFAQIVLHTNVGDITFHMRADKAPGTVDNFLDYVESGRFENSIFHRMVPNFVLQGGGFTSSERDVCGVPCVLSNVDPAQFAAVQTFPPIENEFNISNTRGTVAMAKLGGDPDSATSQFFVNLNNNSANLDAQNGGFTVFAEVVDMTVVNKIAGYRQINIASRFPSNSPLTAISQAPIDITTEPTETRIVRVESITGNAVLHGTLFNDRGATGTLGGINLGLNNLPVYIDSNNNNTFDTGEPTTTTADDGSFHFFVNPGTYTVRVESDILAQFAPANSAANDGVTATLRLGQDKFDINMGFQYSGTSWTNPNLLFDVNGDNLVAPLDALIIINELTDRRVSRSEQNALGSLRSRTDQLIPAEYLNFVDTNSDTFVGPLDALLVINNLPSTTNPPAAALSAAIAIPADGIQVEREDNLLPSSAKAEMPLSERQQVASNLLRRGVSSMAARNQRSFSSADSTKVMSNRVELSSIDQVFADLR